MMTNAASSGSDPVTFGDLASFGLSVKWAEVPPTVRRRVMELITDCIAVAALGSRAPDLESLYRDLGAVRGNATAIGLGTQVSVEAAATLNAVALWRYQYQEGHAAARGHPGTAAFAALFAIAEDIDASAERFLSAFLASYEIGVRCGAAMGGTKEGVHDLGSWGPVGVAGGAAILLGGDWKAVAGAMANAGQMALATSAETVFSGDRAQYTFLPSSIQNGMLSAAFSLSGIHSDSKSLFRSFPSAPLKELVGKHGRRTLPFPSSGADDAWTVLDGYIKLYPICGLLLSAVEAAIMMHRVMARSREPAKAIRSLRVTVVEDAMIFSKANPASDLEARFSLPFTVAWALLKGEIWTDALSDRQLHDPEVAGLANALRMHALNSTHRGRQAVVEIALASGRSLTTRASSSTESDLIQGSLSRSGQKAHRLLRIGFGSGSDDVLGGIADLGDLSIDPRGLGLRMRRHAHR